MNERWQIVRIEPRNLNSELPWCPGGGGEQGAHPDDPARDNQVNINQMVL